MNPPKVYQASSRTRSLQDYPKVTKSPSPTRDHQELPQRIPRSFPKIPKGSLQRVTKTSPKEQMIWAWSEGGQDLHQSRADDLGNQDGIYNLKGASFVTLDNWRAQAFPKISQGSPQEVTQTSTPSNHHLSNSPIPQSSSRSNSPTSQLPNSPTHPTFQILVTQIICSLGGSLGNPLE